MKGRRRKTITKVTLVKERGPSARQHAVEALVRVLNKGQKPKEVLTDLLLEDRRDRSFLMELVYGVLRHRDYLDWIIDRHLAKPSGLSPRTRNNLRLAAYQIYHTRVPAWAAVDETVEIEKARGGRPAVVNGVLRNLLRESRERPVPPLENPTAFIATTTSHPAWLVKRWVKRFGSNTALRLAEANNRIPPLTVRVASTADREAVIRRLRAEAVAAEPTRHSPDGITLNDSVVFEKLAALMTVPCFVQDEAAQLVSYLLAPLPGELVLDACAAPGGKATHLAELMNETGQVVAVEEDERRLVLLNENIHRLGAKSVRPVCADVRLMKADILFDRILLDAPCSALGVIRRNPDVKYRLTKVGLTRLQERQFRLMGAVARLLRPGGTMVYAVCSTEPEEGEEVVYRFLRGNKNFSIIEGNFGFLEPFAVRDALGSVFYRTFPHLHGMDGFFAAKLRRTA